MAMMLLDYKMVTYLYGRLRNQTRASCALANFSILWETAHYTMLSEIGE